MATEKRLIDANEAIEKINCLCVDGNENWIGTDNQSFVDHADVIDILSDIPTVDAYTEEQVASIIQQADKLEARNKDLEKECAWLKSCLNCKIRKECPRHCGKVVHDCDHWEYGDSTVDAVEVEDKQLLRAVKLLIEQYEHSKNSEYVRRPVCHALFHTWKRLDEECDRKRSEGK